MTKPKQQWNTVEYLDPFPITEDSLISFFMSGGADGGNFTYYTTGVVLVETNIWKLPIEFLESLERSSPMNLNILFWNTDNYKGTWAKANNFGTYPALGGLKSLYEVVKLRRTQSIHFIMDD